MVLSLFGLNPVPSNDSVLNKEFRIVHGNNCNVFWFKGSISCEVRASYSCVRLEKSHVHVLLLHCRRRVFQFTSLSVEYALAYPVKTFSRLDQRLDDVFLLHGQVRNVRLGILVELCNSHFYETFCHVRENLPLRKTEL